jgi:FMN phosphatase YigB (HAD superfamily)
LSKPGFRLCAQTAEACLWAGCRPKLRTLCGNGRGSRPGHRLHFKRTDHDGRHDKLVIISNADTSFLDVSVPKLGADFHAVYTAEQAGFYKPRYRAFEYMVEQLDASPEDFLHVSSHTRYDLMPADYLGFTHKVLLDRGYDPHSPAYNYTTVDSLDQLNKLLGL